MKIELELNIPDDRTFLNFWNSYNGDDVVCQVIDGKLMLSQYNENGDLLDKEISLTEFLEMVKSKVEEMSN